jgi:hypothetical protein
MKGFLGDDFGNYRVLFSFCLRRNRLKDELIKETPTLKTVKDWIAADFETWDKVLNKKDTESYSITVSGEELKNSSSKRIKK